MKTERKTNSCKTLVLAFVIDALLRISHIVENIHGNAFKHLSVFLCKNGDCFLKSAEGQVNCTTVEKLTPWSN